MKRKPIIFAIVGPSGSGKTTAADFASKALGILVICSYTNRPMRPGERQYREHIFVSDIDTPQSKDDLLAYTEFGGYKYWATKSQVAGDCIYIVDERGYDMLCDNDNFAVIGISIECNRPFCDKERSDRDNDRKSAKHPFDITIVNDSSIEAFEMTLADSIYCTLSQLDVRINRYNEDQSEAFDAIHSDRRIVNSSQYKLFVVK